MKLEAEFMFLDFHHDIMNVDELILDRPVLKRRLRHDLLQAMIKLYQLSKSCLQYLSARLEVSKTSHYVCINIVYSSLPISIEASDQLTYLLYKQPIKATDITIIVAFGVRSFTLCFNKCS